MELGKRQEFLKCTLMMAERPGDWRKVNTGEAKVGAIDEIGLLQFSGEDGSQLCWQVASSNTYKRTLPSKIVFSNDMDRFQRALVFQETDTASEFWTDLQKVLRIEKQEEVVSKCYSELSHGTPNSNMSQMYQNLYLTSVDSMAETHITTDNLDSIKQMIEMRADAAQEFVRTDPQIQSLNNTFETLLSQEEHMGIEAGQGKPTKLQKLIEIVRLIGIIFYY